MSNVKLALTAAYENSILIDVHLYTSTYIQRHLFYFTLKNLS